MLLNINLLLNSNSKTCRQVGLNSLNEKKSLRPWDVGLMFGTTGEKIDKWKWVKNVSNMHVNPRRVLMSVWFSLLCLSHVVNVYFIFYIHISSLEVLKSLKYHYVAIRPHKIMDVSVVRSQDCDQDKDYLHAFMLRLCREWSLSSQNNGADLWNMTILRRSWLLIGIVSSFKRAICLHLQQWRMYNK